MLVSYFHWVGTPKPEHSKIIICFSESITQPEAFSRAIINARIFIRDLICYELYWPVGQYVIEGHDNLDFMQCVHYHFEY